MFRKTIAGRFLARKPVACFRKSLTTAAPESHHRVAFRVAYLGYNYYGFTTNHNEEAMPTIQGQLLKGLLQTKLIQDPLTCDFSLSGRTDTGVSGLGQVVALNVRQGSFPYIAMINSQLPPDIRVTAWASVPDNFDARFDCQSRTYHYYFPTQDMDIGSMQQAAQQLIGHHDFRNFCKFNPSKNLQHYHRTVLSAELHQVNPAFARLEIKGTAFLWHQVRCIVSILLLVGQRLESPNVVRWLLDVDQVPGKPEYPLASSLPLLLYDCEFDGIEWQHDRTGRVHDNFRLLWGEQMTKALLYQSFVEAIDPVPSPKVKRVKLGAHKEICTASYKPLMGRTQSKPYAEKQQMYNKSRESIDLYEIKGSYV